MLARVGGCWDVAAGGRIMWRQQGLQPAAATAAAGPRNAPAHLPGIGSMHLLAAWAVALLARWIKITEKKKKKVLKLEAAAPACPRPQTCVISQHVYVGQGEMLLWLLLLLPLQVCAS